MRDFTICIGTTFVFGRDAETKVGDELGAKGRFPRAHPS